MNEQDLAPPMAEAWVAATQQGQAPTSILVLDVSGETWPVAAAGGEVLLECFAADYPIETTFDTLEASTVLIWSTRATGPSGLRS